VIQPIKEVTALAKKYGALVHTDAVQAYGRIPVDIQYLGVDFLTLSGHKIGGPQGIGCLVIANCVAVTPLLRGGNQEKNLRAGTENLAGICGLTEAMTAIDLGLYTQLEKWRDQIETELLAHAPTLGIFGADSERVGNTTLFALPGASSETQLIALDLARICVSNGSACSSGTVKPSTVITAMGGTEDEAMSALRISLGWNTTIEDVTHFITEWKKMYDRIQSRINVA
jgi:cysteine desulfurase